MQKLGHDIRDARRRRRIPVKILAERTSISRMTLNKIENGNAGVYIGNYVTALFALGLIDRLADLVDRSNDGLARELADEQLPKPIRLSRSPKPLPPEQRHSIQQKSGGK